jgi:hypothetical protein
MPENRGDHSNSIPANEAFDGSTTEKPTSQKKIEANRRNALRSTGPRTVRGRRTVSRNAIKHGLLAREVVILTGDGAESLKEFRKLCDQLEAHYQPANIMEAKEVETIACCLWRLARVQRAEKGELRKGSDSYKSALSAAAVDRFWSYFQARELSRKARAEGKNEAKHAMKSEEAQLMQRAGLGVIGLELWCDMLDQIKNKLKHLGEISEADYECFTLYFGENHQFLAMCPIEGKSRDDDGVFRGKDLAVFFIDEELKALKMAIKEQVKRNKLEEGAEGQSVSLPSAGATDKILRYESHLDRKLQRAMDNLERMQRQRRGESVPLPVNVTLHRT